ncbi:ceramidase domain-containing protein [Aminobacter anthyllidis]|uniref:Ceramidase domain-containing protein n=1 Tax=Aminobacter anthyllidis TaxID=1035067 RepID=A0A9X1AFD4_9HYPH|nr:ceramidase domain-containing protein [Aminobacter anthyllidis]MBT1158949.1 ceramidase domain-containing protein [Aminobacter anthyllidis]
MLEQFSQHLDLYCERTDIGLWAEPLNAVSNLAFFAAGLWGVYEARRRKAGTFAELLGWWVVAIGIGSTLFHTFATEGTKWADIIPIAGFTLAYTLFNLRRFAGMGWPRALAIFLGFYVAVGFLTYMVPDWLRVASNGTTGYLPPFLALVFFGGLVIATGSRAGWYNIVAAGIFLGSVTFRVIDPIVCDAFPLGSHFMWHVLNGLMLGVLLAATTRYGKPRTGQAGDENRARMTAGGALSGQ